MKKAPVFAHRPPSTGVHLLSDPFPEHLVPRPTLVTETYQRTSTERSFDKVIRSRKTR